MATMMQSFKNLLEQSSRKLSRRILDSVDIDAVVVISEFGCKGMDGCGMERLWLPSCELQFFARLRELVVGAKCSWIPQNSNDVIRAAKQRDKRTKPFKEEMSESSWLLLKKEVNGTLGEQDYLMPPVVAHKGVVRYQNAYYLIDSDNYR